jgi:hypothetical protein
MKLTIVADDGAVGIDGEFFFGLALPQLDLTIHAVQWYGEYGEVEYKTSFENGVLGRAANLLITDVAPFQFAVDAWQTAKENAIAAEAAAVAAAEAKAEADAQSDQQSAPVQNDAV